MTTRLTTGSIQVSSKTGQLHPSYLRLRASHGPLTIVYGARDTEHNDAVVLAVRALTRQMLMS